MPLWRRKGVSTDEIIETVTRAATGPAATTVPATKGYLADIPLGGTTAWNPGSIGAASRREFADQLYGAYMSCPWASACVDVIARTVTAGGLEIVPDSADEGESSPAPPPEVLRLRELFDFVNPRENMRQLLTSVVTNLLVFGDAFVEVVYLADQPVALYTLDSPSMIPIADEHGTVSSYTQQLDPNRTADFEPREVLHFTLGGPREGVYGVGGIQKALLPITAWLFTAGLLKETMRKGDPPRVHLDYPLDTPRNEIEGDREKWLVKNLGIANVGNPFITKGGAKADDLKVAAVAEYLSTLDQKRNEIIASMGVPPRKLSIAEAGQLGGTGEGAASDKTFRVNTCGPLSELVLEVFDFGLVFMAFGITDWSIKLGEVDWRDDQVIETIRDQRLRNGSWTLNRYKNEIGEPEIGPAGDISVMVERQLILDWDDVDRYSAGLVAQLEGSATPPAGGSAPAPTESDDGNIAASLIELALARPARSPEDEEAALTEAFNRDFQQRRKRALKELARTDA